MEKQKEALSEAQAIVLASIKKLYQERGQMPTTQEIAEDLGWDTQQYGRDKVYSHLQQLKLKGHIKRTSPKRARNIEIV